MGRGLRWRTAPAACASPACRSWGRASPSPLPPRPAAPGCPWLRDDPGRRGPRGRAEHRAAGQLRDSDPYVGSDRAVIRARVTRGSTMVTGVAAIGLRGPRRATRRRGRAHGGDDRDRPHRRRRHAPSVDGRDGRGRAHLPQRPAELLRPVRDAGAVATFACETATPTARGQRAQRRARSSSSASKGSTRTRIAAPRADGSIHPPSRREGFEGAFLRVDEPRGDAGARVEGHLVGAVHHLGGGREHLAHPVGHHVERGGLRQVRHPIAAPPDEVGVERSKSGSMPSRHKPGSDWIHQPPGPFQPNW